MSFLVTHFDGVCLFLHLSCDINRNKHQRRITGLFALVSLVPAEESEGKVDGIRTVFLDADFCLSVELFHYLFKLALLQECTQAMALEFVFGDGGYLIFAVFKLVYLAVGHCQRHIIGHGHDLEFLILRHFVL